MSRDGKERWKDRPPGGNDLEDEAAKLFRGARRANPLPPEALNDTWVSVAGKIALSAAAGGLAGAGAKAGLHSIAKWKVMLAVATVAVGTGSVATRVLLRAKVAKSVPTAPAASLGEDATSLPRAPGALGDAAPSAVGSANAFGSGHAEVGSPTVMSVPQATRRVDKPQMGGKRRGVVTKEANNAQVGLEVRAAPGVSILPVAREEPKPVAAESGSKLAGESALLGLAVKQLRVENDPHAAVATLEQYEARFHDGALSREATVTRIDALLALGRRGEVLKVLEGVELGTLPRRIELQVLRGELLSEAGRCASGLGDFDQVLLVPRAAAIEERALFGRAVCRGAVGDQSGHTSDLKSYLDRFPDGRFAKAARAALSVKP